MRGQQLRRPVVQLLQVLIGKRVLILRRAAASADLDVLLRLQIERSAGSARQFAAQAGHHLVGRDAPGTLVAAA